MSVDSSSTAVLKRVAPVKAAGPASRAPRFGSEEVLDALRRWTRQFGEPPTILDLEPSRARRVGQAWRAERFEAAEWPTIKMVTGHFQSLSAALKQAGVRQRRGLQRGVSSAENSQAVLDAIRKWVVLYGAVPTLADWDPSRARRVGQDWRIARYYQGDWPSSRFVISRFGSMSSAINAAGLPARPHGHHGGGQLARNSSARLASALHLGGDVEPDAPALARAIRDLAEARSKQDPVAVHRSLIEIAAVALAWADRAG